MPTVNENCEFQYTKEAIVKDIEAMKLGRDRHIAERLYKMILYLEKRLIENEEK